MEVAFVVRDIKLGLAFGGAGGNVSSWRQEGVPSDAGTDFGFQKDLALRAERALFDFVFVAYSDYVGPSTQPFHVSRFEPIVQLSALAAITSRIGLVGTMSTTFNAPYTVARQMGSLDVLSGGRAGWNVVTAAVEDAAQNYGGEKIPAHDDRYALAEEFYDAVQAVWDTWQPDAFVRDKARNIYVDPDKFRRTDFRGEHYSVLGPPNIERSAQGSPVIFQAGASPAGLALAGRIAEGVFTNYTADDDLAKYNQGLTEAMEAAGRSRSDVRVLAGIRPIIGSTPQEAREKLARANALLDDTAAMNLLSRFFSFHDLTQYDPDQPPPAGLAEHAKDSYASSAMHLLEVAQRDGLSLRQLAYHVAAPQDRYTGTAEQVADELESVFERGLSDGFILINYLEPSGTIDFIREVVPILQRRGLYRTEYTAATLRGHLFP
jgi:FMN-dependent oxidoreductase (nitrilotriacetate monooxygenase family)